MAEVFYEAHQISPLSVVFVLEAQTFVLVNPHRFPLHTLQLVEIRLSVYRDPLLPLQVSACRLLIQNQETDFAS